MFRTKQNMSEPTTTLLIEWDFENDDVSEITDGDTEEIYDYDYDYDYDNDYNNYEICKITMEQGFPLSDEDRTTDWFKGMGSQGKP